MLAGETVPISVGSVEDSRLPFPSKVDAPSMHASLNLYRFYRDAATLRGMDNGVAVYLPKPGFGCAMPASSPTHTTRRPAPDHRLGALAADIMVQPDAHANSHVRGWRRLINPNGVRMLSAIARYPNTATSGRNRPTMISAT